ncbi:MAG TPA: hypothetical protein VGB07_05300, partial [Blastocatellia bacterium]
PSIQNDVASDLLLISWIGFSVCRAVYINGHPVASSCAAHLPHSSHDFPGLNSTALTSYLFERWTGLSSGNFPEDASPEE